MIAKKPVIGQRRLNSIPNKVLPTAITKPFDASAPKGLYLL